MRLYCPTIVHKHWRRPGGVVKRRGLLQLVAFAGLLACASAALAETVYVNDMLRVGVRKHPNSSETPITIVTTGMALDVLEHRDGYMKIRTKDGVEGWINDVYATDEVPARRRLEEITAEQKRLKEALAKERSTAAGAQKESGLLRDRLTDLAKRNRALQDQLGQARSTLAMASSGNRWLYVGAGTIVLFLLGFFLGTRWYRQRVAERFGGLHV
jgi:hypothetical protein